MSSTSIQLFTSCCCRQSKHRTIRPKRLLNEGHCLEDKGGLLTIVSISWRAKQISEPKLISHINLQAFFFFGF